MAQGLINDSNDVDFEQAWTIVAESLRQMHTKNASNLSFEKIFRHAYKMVLKKKGDVFYDRLQRFEQDWLGQDVRAKLASLLAPTLRGDSDSANGGIATANERRMSGERFLRGLKDCFEDHQLVMNMATDVFMYLVSLLYNLNSVDRDADMSFRIAYTVQMPRGLKFIPQQCYYGETIFSANL